MGKTLRKFKYEGPEIPKKRVTHKMQLEAIHYAKMVMIRAFNYEKAAKLRDFERKLMSEFNAELDHRKNPGAHDIRSSGIKK